MAKHIACGDVVEGCGFTAQGGTDEELLAAVKAHAAEDHGVTEVTPELAAKVKAAIRPARQAGAHWTPAAEIVDEELAARAAAGDELPSRPS